MALCERSEGSTCDLVDDLWTEILSRLPPKPLIICKCVSKRFRLLVSTLIHSQTRARQMSGLFLGLIRGNLQTFKYFRDDDRDTDINLSFLPCHPNTRVVDCRDGFFLCSSWYNGRPANYYVCNPVTRQWVVLPPPPEHDGSDWVEVSFGLVIDGSSDACLRHFKVVQFVVDSPHHFNVFQFVFNSGDDPKPQQYLNVCSSKDEDADPPLADLYIYVYSSRTGQWAESKPSLKRVNFARLEMPSVFVNGALFLSAPPHHALMFDVEEEHCKVLNLPSDLGVSIFFDRNCLGESEGCLNYACHDDSKMEVWMIDSSNPGDWILKHSFDLDDCELSDPSDDSDPIPKDPLRILAFHPNLDAIFFRNQGDFFCRYFDSGTLEKFISYEPSATMFRLYPFSECLCSLASARPRI